jgi:hypothetical protein
MDVHCWFILKVTPFVIQETVSCDVRGQLMVDSHPYLLDVVGFSNTPFQLNGESHGDRPIFFFFF